MVEPAPDELMEILDEWGRAAMDVLIEPRISPTDLMAAKNEAHTAIEALYAARFERAIGADERILGVSYLEERNKRSARNSIRAEARTRWEKEREIE